MELKTQQDIEPHEDKIKYELKYERKLLKFWIQSFLLGVPKIIVGFRNRNGILKRLEELETQKIPDLVKAGHRSWDGNTCLMFMQHFLESTLSPLSPLQMTIMLTMNTGRAQGNHHRGRRLAHTASA